MRKSGLFATVAFGLLAASAAIAEAPLQFGACYEKFHGELIEQIVVTAGPDIIGRPCMVYHNGIMLVSVLPLHIGENEFNLPQTNAQNYLISSPGVEGKWINIGHN